jgi:hypothetical protein
VAAANIVDAAFTTGDMVPSNSRRQAKVSTPVKPLSGRQAPPSIAKPVQNALKPAVSKPLTKPSSKPSTKRRASVQEEAASPSASEPPANNDGGALLHRLLDDLRITLAPSEQA